MPEGTVLSLTVDDEGDDLDEVERAALHDAISRSWSSVQAGRGVATLTTCSPRWSPTRAARARCGCARLKDYGAIAYSVTGISMSIPERSRSFCERVRAARARGVAPGGLWRW